VIAGCFFAVFHLFSKQTARCPHVDANKKMTLLHKWVVANRREPTLQISQTMPHMDEALFKYATKILHTHAANIR
jgi:transcription antitermination factor NusA-like protein